MNQEFYSFFSTIKSKLNGAPVEVRKSFNTLVEYFSEVVKTFSHPKRDLLGKFVEVWLNERRINQGKVEDIKYKNEIDILDNTDYDGPYYKVNGIWYQDDPDHSYTSYIKCYE